MLKSLSIRDYIIVDTLDLDFAAGLTVFTGETGAGKSILIDALSLALGGRAETGLVRPGASRAEIAAVFDVSDNSGVQQLCQNYDIPFDEDNGCLLKRVVDQQGKSKAFINGSAVTLTQLKEIAEQVINIHGQHAHQTLQSSSTQRQLLDSFAGHESLVLEVREAYRKWQNTYAQWRDWQEKSASLAADEARLKAEINELEALAIPAEQWLEFNEQHTRLTHAQQVLVLNQQVLELLNEGENSARERVDKALILLESMPYQDKDLVPLQELLKSASIQMDEALMGIRHFIHGVELDDQRLSELDEHMTGILQLSRRYRVNPDALWHELEERRQQLAAIELVSDGERLEEEWQKAKKTYLAYAEKLSQHRKKVALSLSSKISETLSELALGDGQFLIQVEPLNEPSQYGIDQVVFKVSTHAKQAPQDIAKVASGGELSRISLAIQAVLSQSSSVPTLIFDEVDTGIGGRVAEIVGRLLRDLSEHCQVLCVTHLPQVASCAQHHFRVAKEASNEAVVSRVEVLSEAMRVEEIARMLGGIAITPTTLKHAKEMLSLAHQ